MITRADIVERVTEWGLTEEVIEKDYVLGWLLWGIGTDPDLSRTWVFKGGTCLKKCYIETYRFSEDLDFTVLPGGPFRPEEVQPLIERCLVRIANESGIDFNPAPPSPAPERDLDRGAGVLHRPAAHAPSRAREARPLGGRESCASARSAEDHSPVPRHVRERRHDPLLFI